MWIKKEFEVKKGEIKVILKWEMGIVKKKIEKNLKFCCGLMIMEFKEGVYGMEIERFVEEKRGHDQNFLSDYICVCSVWDKESGDCLCIYVSIIV